MAALHEELALFVNRRAGDPHHRVPPRFPAYRRCLTRAPTVRTREGDFTGLVQWDRRACLGDDELKGSSTDCIRSLRFDAIRSIARRAGDSSLVTLLDGSEIVLWGSRAVGHENSGIYVDDQRYGRVLVSWDAFERVEFGRGSATRNITNERPLGVTS